MTPDAVARFNAARLAAQFTLFNAAGVDASGKAIPCFHYRGTLYPAAVAAIKSAQQLVDGGFETLCTAVARLQKSDLPAQPVKGETVTVLETPNFSGGAYTIAEVHDSALSGEWKLGLTDDH